MEKGIVGELNVEALVKLVLTNELMHEKYGVAYEAMYCGVQNDLTMIFDRVDIQVAVECLQKKCLDPGFSMKSAFISAMMPPSSQS